LLKLPLNQDLAEQTLTGETDLTMGYIDRHHTMERDISINNLNLDRPDPIRLNSTFVKSPTNFSINHKLKSQKFAQQNLKQVK
jgi:hypothetical protein